MKQIVLEPDTIIMKNGLFKSVKASRKRYGIYLEGQISERKKEGQKSKEKQILQCELDLLRLQKNS